MATVEVKTECECDGRCGEKRKVESGISGRAEIHEGRCRAHAIGIFAEYGERAWPVCRPCLARIAALEE